MSRRAPITVLAGGVGAARFLRGLVRVTDASAVRVIVNTGDDEEFYGLHVSPDLDTIVYTLSGEVEERQGWGLRDDTTAFLRAAERFYGPAWFRLGDRDLATHVFRTERLRAGWTLSQVTQAVAEGFGVRPLILPMSDDPVRTIIDTAAGPRAFQDYLVRRRARDRVWRVRFRGAVRARPAPGVLDALAQAEAIIIAPSNPVVSIGPILAVPGVRRALRRRHVPVAAISPLIGGRPVKGPADRMLAALGHEPSPVGVAAWYGSLLDLMIIDERDGACERRLRQRGLQVFRGDLLLDSPARAEAAATQVLDALASTARHTALA